MFEEIHCRDALDGLQPLRDQLHAISMFWKNLPKKGEVVQRPLAVLRDDLASHQATKREKGGVAMNTPETPEDVEYENIQHVDVRVCGNECLAE